MAKLDFHQPLLQSSASLDSLEIIQYADLIAQETIIINVKNNCAA